MHYVVQEEMIGQTHAIFLAKDLIAVDIMTFSDTLLGGDISFLVDEDADGIACVHGIPSLSDWRSITVENNRIERFIEKPSPLI
jgi:glucose-1-phosphate thymidylyltransferase